MNEYWKGIYGQQSVKDVLSALIASKRLPHAMIFQGPQGSGKDFFALRFANVLHHTNTSSLLDEVDYSALTSLDEPLMKFIYPLPAGRNETQDDGPYAKLSKAENDAATEERNKKRENPYYRISIPKAKQIKINSIRDINSFLSYRDNRFPYRFVIISRAHLMNEAAQNALLKNLEEPPEGIIFILTTDAPGLLRETIRSRCWSINFEPLAEEDISRALVNYFGTEPDKADSVTGYAKGSVLNAADLLGKNIEGLKERTIEFLRNSLAGRYHTSLKLFNEMMKEFGDDALALLIRSLINWMADVERFRSGTGDYFFSEFEETFRKFNERFSDADFTGTVTRLEWYEQIVTNNNANLNIAATNIIFELASITDKTLQMDKEKL